MKYLYIALSSIILAYIIIALFTYLYQRKLLYHPSENNYTGDEIQFEYKEVFIEVDKNIKLKSWFLEKDKKKNKTILFFHGNAGDLTNRVHKLNELNKLDVNILIISWRGSVVIKANQQRKICIMTLENQLNGLIELELKIKK